MQRQAVELQNNQLVNRQALIELITATGKGCQLSEQEVTAQLELAILNYSNDKIDKPDNASNSLILQAAKSENLIAVRLLLANFDVDKNHVEKDILLSNIVFLSLSELENTYINKDFQTKRHEIVDTLIEFCNSNLADLLKKTISWVSLSCALRKINNSSLKQIEKEKILLDYFLRAIRAMDARTMKHALCYADIKKIGSNIKPKVMLKDYLHLFLTTSSYTFQRTAKSNISYTPGRIFFPITEGFIQCFLSELIEFYLYGFHLTVDKIRLNDDYLKVFEILISMGWNTRILLLIAAAYHEQKLMTRDIAKRLINAYPNPFSTEDLFYLVSMNMTDILNQSALVTEEALRGTHFNQSLLTVAIDYRYDDMTIALLEKGVPVNIETGTFLSNRLHSPALLAAIRKNNLPIIKLLLKHHAILENNKETRDLINSASSEVKCFLNAYLAIKYQFPDAEKLVRLLSNNTSFDLYDIFKANKELFKLTHILSSVILKHIQEKETQYEQVFHPQATQDTLETQDTASNSSSSASSSSLNAYPSFNEKRKLLLNAISTTGKNSGVSAEETIQRIINAYVEFPDINTPDENGSTPFGVALKTENRVALIWLMKKKYLGENLLAFDNFNALINDISVYDNRDYFVEIALMLLEGPLKDFMADERKPLFRNDNKQIGLTAGNVVLYVQLFEALLMKGDVQRAMKVNGKLGYYPLGMGEQLKPGVIYETQESIVLQIQIILIAKRNKKISQEQAKSMWKEQLAKVYEPSQKYIILKLLDKLFLDNQFLDNQFNDVKWIIRQLYLEMTQNQFTDIVNAVWEKAANRITSRLSNYVRAMFTTSIYVKYNAIDHVSHIISLFQSLYNEDKQDFYNYLLAQGLSEFPDVNQKLLEQFPELRAEELPEPSAPILAPASSSAVSVPEQYVATPIPDAPEEKEAHVYADAEVASILENENADGIPSANPLAYDPSSYPPEPVQAERREDSPSISTPQFVSASPALALAEKELSQDDQVARLSPALAQEEGEPGEEAEHAQEGIPHNVQYVSSKAYSPTLFGNSERDKLRLLESLANDASIFGTSPKSSAFGLLLRDFVENKMKKVG